MSVKTRLDTADAGFWDGLPASHQPEWPNSNRYHQVLAHLATADPVVQPQDCNRLRNELAAASRGEAFVVHSGDCAEPFSACAAPTIRCRARLLAQMALVLTGVLKLPIVKIGRVAGQYAKPRSNPTETRQGVTLPSYFGDAVNGVGFSERTRRPDPARLLTAYRCSVTAARNLRRLSEPRLDTFWGIYQRNISFVHSSPMRHHYGGLNERIDAGLRWMATHDASPRRNRGHEVFTSHEALLLDYESRLVRRDSKTGLPYATSAHLPWIGNRTRQTDHAHVAFAASIANPIAVKLGPTATTEELLTVARILNPKREEGRLIFVTRLGKDNVETMLPRWIAALQRSGDRILWMCDPMHGNTMTAPNGYKTRQFDDITAEITKTAQIHRRAGSWLGGLHLETSHLNVTECAGGQQRLRFEDLPRRYESMCDPRLNETQSLEIAYCAAETIRPSNDRWVPSKSLIL